MQTLSTLRSLDADRNITVLQFLQEAHLIGIQHPVINLSNADLHNDDLTGADLSGVDLSGSNLTGTKLSNADLRAANLNYANLSSVELSGANLSDAYLRDATLTSADMDGAHLARTALTGALLGGANLTGADLGGTTLTGAWLAGAHLNGADLGDAHLNRADLSGADLSGADLTDADLTDFAVLTQPQLDEVHSCTAAILSTGLICHHITTITLTYWYTESPAETPVIRMLIDRFERLYPYIKINAVNKPYFETEAAFTTAAQAGEAPDVLRSDVSWVTQFASQGYLLKIDPYTSQYYLSDYLRAPLEYDTYNGHLYGLPQVTDFLALLYNKTELKKAGISSPPATMADFEADAAKVVQSKAAAYGFETSGTSYYALPFLYAFGGGMLDQHNNILVNSQGSIAGLNFLLKLQNIDNVMPPTAGSAGSMVNDFMSGRTAMIFDGPYDVSEILADSAFRGKPNNLGIARIPTGPAGQTGSPLGGQSYVISAGTAHPAEAYKFISFMNLTANQAAIARANHTLPTRQSAYQYGASSDPVISAFIAIKQTTVTRPLIPQEGHLFDDFDPNIEAALYGVQDPKSALNAVANAWKQLLAGS